MADDTDVLEGTKTIWLMDGGSSYDEEVVTCETVKCLREHKGIPDNAVIRVNKRKADDNTLIEDKDFVSVARTNKSGGK
mgnify:CR=1 FL=1